MAQETPRPTPSRGNSAANTLDGGAGADTLIGSVGDDSYMVDNASDVTESASQGADTIFASVTYTLAANLENITLTGASTINANGNTLGNILTGNSAANTLAGGSGNDTYVVVDLLDTLVELNGGGTDTVQSSVSYPLGANFENLTLTGTSVIDAFGNTLNNILTGNSASNTLTGGIGNDTYIIDATDTIVELLAPYCRSREI